MLTFDDIGKTDRRYLYYKDTNFLTELTKHPIKDFYAKIIIRDISDIKTQRSSILMLKWLRENLQKRQDLS